ncbi:MAG: hypothetical protein A2W71_01360 [Candidatus Nealsonbacteria bacterium RIFCSPLOWO2_02_39_8]|uniref:ComEC/Rec2-related protein domain-containing protein n=1 Tax=Candidatus Nealsonbacteria bacterium RIFCSPLOWO2_02_39_8 TaxID=1801674 RepID=A0A1G2EK61_9BACT|nr:MAG: hypothetical protein A2W71_01360 [Candidatus Nealsonbacteria bacterium RIFCSPLOWO2_02_39_8]
MIIARNVPAIYFAMTDSKIFFYLCLSLIVGVFASSAFAVLLDFSFNEAVFLFICACLAVSGIILISVFWGQKNVVVLGFCLIFFALGFFRHQAQELGIKNNELKKYNNSGEEIILTGAVVREPDVREKSGKLTIGNIEVQNYGSMSRSFEGKILATIPRYPEYKYGDKLRITGKLETPAIFEDFNYKDYLEKEGIYSVLYLPTVELLENQANRGHVFAIFGKILDFKGRLRQGIYQNLPLTQSSVLAAMILGDNSAISDELKQELNFTGSRHIIAISGMHIVIIVNLLMILLLGFGLWRGQAFYIAIIIISVFIFMTGLQPSGIRAGIMGGLLLLGQKVGRKSASFRSIILAAAIMLAINPMLLFHDVGFQLSFLATMGIIYLESSIRDWLKFLPENNFFKLKSIISMTMSAQIFTLPILIYNFGNFSLVSLLVNILILPAVDWIMIFGFIYAGSAAVSSILGWIISFPTWLLINYLLKIVELFSKLNWLAIDFKNIHWFWLVVAYLIIGILSWKLFQRRKLKFLDY